MRGRRGRAPRCAVVVLATALALVGGCSSRSPVELDASSPVVDRHGDEIVVRWSEAPAGAALAIYAGPSPEAIDRATPVAHLVDGRAEIPPLPFPGRPYFEIDRPDGEPIRLAERRLPLDGMDNFRDLGGYRTTDGRVTRWGRVYRSGQLSDLTDADLAYLDELGIALVCDFRSPSERERRPDRLPTRNPPRVIRPEIFTPGVDPAALQDKLLRGDLADLDLSELLVEGNRAFATEFADRYREMFDQLLDERNLPAVLHCTAGKDRAGMAAALVLLAVGVPEETVMEDFLLTNAYTEAKIQQQLTVIWLASLFRSNPVAVRPLLGVEPRYLQAGLDAMRERDGSIDAYLRDSLGLTDEKRERLRESLLEPRG